MMLDNNTVTNYEEYSYNMPDDYNLTRDGPYMGILNQINPDSGNNMALSENLGPGGI